MGGWMGTGKNPGKGRDTKLQIRAWQKAPKRIQKGSEAPKYENGELINQPHRRSVSQSVFSPTLCVLIWQNAHFSPTHLVTPGTCTRAGPSWFCLFEPTCALLGPAWPLPFPFSAATVPCPCPPSSARTSQEASRASSAHQGSLSLGPTSVRPRIVRGSHLVPPSTLDHAHGMDTRAVCNPFGFTIRQPGTRSAHRRPSDLDTSRGLTDGATPPLLLHPSEAHHHHSSSDSLRCVGDRRGM